MKSSLLSKYNAEKIIERAAKLSPDCQGKWGKMDVTEMLLHCNISNRFIVGDNATYQKPTLKQKIAKWIVFNFLSRIPKNNIGPLRTQTKGLVDKSAFKIQQLAFAEGILQIQQHNKSFHSIHHSLGWLDDEEWGRISWMHMDHHLRQFGV